ncbi:MAG TPA: hypothetical protein VIH61_05790 [Waddliaceae bacterium]
MEKRKVFDLIGIFRFRIPRFLPGELVRVIDERHNAGALNVDGSARNPIVLGKVYEIAEVVHGSEGWWLLSLTDFPELFFSLDDFEMVSDEKFTFGDEYEDA